jgi:hypothetical protein
MLESQYIVQKAGRQVAFQSQHTYFEANSLLLYSNPSSTMAMVTPWPA